jgi:serine/threonine protein kinase
MPDVTQFDSLKPGAQLNGIYEIDYLVASGGMGEVYKGHAIQTGHNVAIKVIRNEFATNELVRSLFRNEASSLHDLHHEAIVRYFIFAVDPTLGRAYLAMDFVEGESLSQVLRRAPMPVETVARLAARIAGGLHAAHKQGITHRDISPDNIIIQNGDADRAMIIDFGIARATRAGEETIVDTGFAGKYNYVSPEQLGEYGGEVTPKSDIYSLGLVLAAALRGAPIDMSGRPVEVITKRRIVPRLDDIDPKAGAILTRMLQPDPADRPLSMIEVARAFEHLLPPPEQRRSDESNRKKDTAPRSARHHISSVLRFRLLYTGLATISVAVIGIAAAAYYLWQNPTLGPQPVPSTTSVVPSGATPEPNPESPAPNRPSRAERIRSYLANYRAGPCALIVPGIITDGSANVDGFGLKATPFDVLDRAFLSEFGFEAQIRAMIIKPAQCPVLDFLDRVPSDRRLAPHVTLPHTLLRSGTPLSGLVQPPEATKLTLLMISADGSVENVTRFLRPGTGEIRFEIPIPKPASTGEPRLLLTLSSTEPLDISTELGARRSDRFFDNLAADRRRTTTMLGADLVYFQIE